MSEYLYPTHYYLNGELYPVMNLGFILGVVSYRREIIPFKPKTLYDDLKCLSGGNKSYEC